MRYTIYKTGITHPNVIILLNVNIYIYCTTRIYCPTFYIFTLLKFFYYCISMFQLEFATVAIIKLINYKIKLKKS